MQLELHRIAYVRYCHELVATQRVIDADGGQAYAHCDYPFTIGDHGLERIRLHSKEIWNNICWRYLWVGRDPCAICIPFLASNCLPSLFHFLEPDCNHLSPPHLKSKLLRG
jgi:hypothetical protein